MYGRQITVLSLVLIFLFATGLTFHSVYAVTLTKDTSNTCNNSIRTWCTITVANNPNKLIIFQFSWARSNFTGSTPSINNVKDNGVAMTKLTNQTGSGSIYQTGQDVYYLVNPSNGLNNVTFSWVRSAGFSEMGLISLYNVNQASPINIASIAKTGSSNPATISQTITPTQAGSWIFAGTQTLMDDTAPSATADWTSILDSRGQMHFAAQHKTNPTIGAGNTLSWTSGLNGNFGYSVIAYEVQNNTGSTVNIPVFTHANTLNSTAIKLDWALIPGASWYVINFTHPASGVFTKLVNTTATTWTSNGLIAGTQYAFKIKSGNSTASSAFSAAWKNYTQNISPSTSALGTMLDNFGIDELYLSDTSNHTWYNHWNIGAPRNLTSGSTDPNDSFFHARGNGNVYIYANSSDVAKMSGNAPRMYYYPSDSFTNKTEWFKNMEVTLYGMRIQDAGTVSSQGLTVFGRSGSHDSVTFPNECVDSTGNPNSAYNARLLYDGRSDLQKEVIYHHVDAVAGGAGGDLSGTAPNTKQAFFNFTYPNYAMNDNTASFGTTMYGKSKSVYTELFTFTSTAGGMKYDTVALNMKKIGTPTGNATIGIISNNDALVNKVMQDNITSSGVIVYNAHNNPIGELGNSSSVMVGNKINGTKIAMRTQGSPTGNATIGVFNFTSGTSAVNVTSMHQTVNNLGLSMFSGSRHIIVENVNNTSSLVGKTINRLEVTMKKLQHLGADPPGFVIVGTFDSAGNPVVKFANVTAASLSTSYTNKVFSFANYTIVANNRIGVEYNYGNSTLDIAVGTDSADNFDGANSQYQNYNAAWSQVGSADVTMNLLYYVAGVSPQMEMLKQLGTINVATMGGSIANYTFKISSYYQLKAGDLIGVNYTNGDAANYLVVESDTTNSFDGTNSAYAVFVAGTSWTTTASTDITQSIGNFTTPLTQPAILKVLGTLNVATLGTSYTVKTFPQASNLTIGYNQRIGIEYTGGDASNFVSVMTDQVGNFDGINSVLSTATNGTYTNEPSHDLWMQLSSGSGNVTALGSSGFPTMPFKKWIGIKEVIRTMPDNTTVNIQTWEDWTNGVNGGHWFKVNEYNDTGVWAKNNTYANFYPNFNANTYLQYEDGTGHPNGTSFAASCPPGFTTHYIINHGSPYAAARADSVANISYKYFSVRELQTTASPVVTMITTSSARLTVTNPSGNFSGYKVFDATPNSGTFVLGGTSSNQTNRFDLTGLLGNQQYIVQFSTRYGVGTNQSGVSANSTTVSFYTLPNAPTGLVITQTGSGHPVLNWVAPVDNGTVTGYKIERSTDNISWSTVIANTGNSSTEYTDTVPSPGKYYYRVSDIKYGGTSAPSSSANKIIWTYFTVNEYQADGVTPVYGQAIQSNTTSTNNRFTLVGGSVAIPGVFGLNNFTAWNALINFIVFKQYNYNTTLHTSLNMNTHDFTVDCPYTGIGPDAEVWTNGTDGHRISSFTTPTCFANSTIKWSTTFTPNGNNPKSFSTIVYVKVLNATYLTLSPLKYNNTKVTTVFSNPYVQSVTVPVGTGYQTKIFNWSMNYTISPSYLPVNFTVGHLSVSGINPITLPIQFSSAVLNSSATAVTVSFPSAYTMAYQMDFNNEGTSTLLTGLPTTSPTLGRSQSVITFLNPTNDTVRILAYDIPTHTNATYQLTQPNTSIPFVVQFQNFKNGLFGGVGMIGGIDLITLGILIVGMIGFNRVNETVGAIIMIMVVGGCAFFGIIAWPTTMTAAIAMVTVIIVSSTKKLPWS